MHSGMLWFDERKTAPLKDKVIAAALHFQKKYGKAPNLCLVNIKDLAGAELSEVKVTDSIKVTVRPRNFVLYKHVWIGVDNEPMEQRDAEVKA